MIDYITAVGVYILVGLLCCAVYTLRRIHDLLRDKQGSADDASDGDITSGSIIDLGFFNRRTGRRAVKPTDRAKKWIENHSAASKGVR